MKSSSELGDLKLMAPVPLQRELGAQKNVSLENSSWPSGGCVRSDMIYFGRTLFRRKTLQY